MSPNIWNVPQFFEQNNLNFTKCLFSYKNFIDRCENFNSYAASSKNFSEMTSKCEQRLYYDLNIKRSPQANTFDMLDPNSSTVWEAGSEHFTWLRKLTTGELWKVYACSTSPPRGMLPDCHQHMARYQVPPPWTEAFLLPCPLYCNRYKFINQNNCSLP